jgi:hypothetical protein
MRVVPRRPMLPGTSFEKVAQGANALAGTTRHREDGSSGEWRARGHGSELSLDFADPRFTD